MQSVHMSSVLPTHARGLLNQQGTAQMLKPTHSSHALALHARGCNALKAPGRLLIQQRSARAVGTAQAAAVAPAAEVLGTTTAAGAAAVASTAPPLAQLFAVLLGYGCLIGSCFRSVPQIVKVVQTKSAEGLSLTSNLSELVCYTVNVAYNLQLRYPFNTYGDVFACWLQDVVIVGLIFKHMRLSMPIIASVVAVFAACCVWLFSPACTPEVLATLQMSTIAFMAIGARVPQIWLNIKRGDAGVLSVTTCVLNVLGCIIRTYTTLVLTQDTLLLAGCVIQGLLNAILLWQAVETQRKQARLSAAAGKPTPPPDAPRPGGGFVTPLPAT